MKSKLTWTSCILVGAILLFLLVQPMQMQSTAQSIFTKHTFSDNIASAYNVYAADLNGDGDLDVIGTGTNGLIWWINDGEGNFPPNNLLMLPLAGFQLFT